MRYESMVDAIGHTPLVRLAVPAAEGVAAYAKLELQNPFAMKDRVARQVITAALQSGELAPGAPIVESSSGTMALGLALVGTSLGHPVHIVTDPRIDQITRAKLETLGCEVHVVSAMTGQGWQSARLELLAELMASLPGAFWPRQYSNPQNPAAYRTLAAELIEDLGTVDVVVGAVGSGGSLCGTSRALLENLPDLKVVGVDCVGSVLFAQPDLPQRRQSGLGNSLFPANIDYRLFDEVHWLNDDEAFGAARALALEQKIFGGNTSGSVYRVLAHLAARAEPGTTLVGIMPDRGDRYVESVFRAEPAGPVSAEPVEVEYGETVANWSLARIPRRERRVLVFVESNTTGTGVMALETAVRLGVEPVLLTKDAGRYQGLDETGCRVVHCDTEDPAALAAAARTAAAGRTIAGVTTTSDYYLEHSARLAGELGVPGNPPAAAATCRDKSRTRAALVAGGLAQPRYVPVTDPGPEAARAAAAEVGLPCVVKPADESGSRDVLWCLDEQAAADHAARVLSVTGNVRGQRTAGVALFEEYLIGPEYSVEMFCDDASGAADSRAATSRAATSLAADAHAATSRARCVGVTQRTVSALPHFVETGHLFPAELSPAVAEELADIARQALAAVGFVRGPAHVEVKLTARGPVVVEVNGRLAGGMIPELIRLATGIDLVEQQVRAAVGQPLRLAVGRSRQAGIRFLTAAVPGRFGGVRGTEQALLVPGVERVTVTAAVGRAVRPVRDAYDRLGYVIAVGDGPAQVEECLDKALAQLEVIVRE